MGFSGVISCREEAEELWRWSGGNFRTSILKLNWQMLMQLLDGCFGELFLYSNLLSVHVL